MKIRAFVKQKRYFILKNYKLINFIISKNLNKRLFISFFIIGIMAVIYTIFWHSMAVYLKSSIDDWRSYKTDQGVESSYSTIEITGFPLNFYIRINNPRLQAPLAAIGNYEIKKWIWEGHHLIVKLTPWNFNIIKLDLSGSNRFLLKGKNVIYDFASETKLINIDSEMSQDGWPKNIMVRLEGVKILEQTSKLDVSIRSAFFNTQTLLNEDNRGSAKKKNPNRVLQVRLEDLYLPKELRWPADSYVKKLSMKLNIFENLGLILNEKNLKKWRDTGGIIDINLFEAIFGDLKTYASGTLALDQDLQPLLAMTAKFEGIVSLIDKLVVLGYLRTNTAMLAKIIFGGLSGRLGNEQSSIGLPLTIQNRKLSVGPISLFTVPFINWGNGG
jgi:hypothetical protein